MCVILCSDLTIVECNNFFFSQAMDDALADDDRDDTLLPMQRLFLYTSYKSHSFVCTSKCTDDNPHFLSFGYNDLLWKIWERGRDVLDLQQDLRIKW